MDNSVKKKNLEPFIQAFIHAKFSVPVELVVQGATAKPEDTALFNSLIEKYKHITNIIFRHENLIGKDWEEGFAYLWMLLQCRMQQSDIDTIGERCYLLQLDIATGIGITRIKS